MATCVASFRGREPYWLTPSTSTHCAAPFVRRAVRKKGRLSNQWKNAIQQVLEEQARQKKQNEMEVQNREAWRESDFAEGRFSLSKNTYQRMAALPPKVPTLRTKLMANKWQSAMKGTMVMRRANPELYEEKVIQEDEVTHKKTRISGAGTRTTTTTTTSTTTSVPSGVLLEKEGDRDQAAYHHVSQGDSTNSTT